MYAPPRTPIRIVHATDRYAVVEKPAGLLSVPGRGEDKRDSVTTRVLIRIPSATGPISVHRLDQDTSGLMVVALNRKTHATLSKQFMHRKPKKLYTAVLEGHLEPDEGTIELPLIVDWPNRPRQKVCYEEGKPAKTFFTVLDRTELNGTPVTRVEFRPITGRTHQLRVHAATPVSEGGLGSPILGDELYGDPSLSPRLLLHASLLCFWEPITGEWVRFESEASF